MKYSMLLIGMYVFSIIPLCAMPQDTVWIKTFGGSGSEGARSVQQTSDGGYIIAGNTSSFGSGGVWLVKTDSFGNEVWNKTIGGSIGRSVKQTSDGGYIIVGDTYSSGISFFDVFLIKTDILGDTLWTKTFGGIETDRAFDVQQTIDGGYIIVGETSSFGNFWADIWLIKTNSFGDTLWTRIYGGSNHDRGYSVQQTSDGGFIIAGETYSFGAGGRDAWLIKTDHSGDTLWTKTYGSRQSDWCRSVKQTLDGGYIFVGKIDSTEAGDHQDVWLVKTDANGDTIWTRAFGDYNSDWGNSVQQTSDKGYIIAGKTWSYGAGAADIWIIKTDSLGNSQ